MAGRGPASVRALPQLLGALPALRRAVSRLCVPNPIDARLEGTGMRYRQAMHSTLDVLTFLAYAAMLGLCMGALLGAFALMLASQAHAAGDAAGGLLLHRPPSEAASAAPLVSTETIFRSDGPIRHVRIVQAYRNPFHERQEGLYVLRLPQNATLE